MFKTKASMKQSPEVSEPAVVEQVAYDDSRLPEKESKPNHKLNTLDIYVIFSIISLIVYTIISQLMVIRTGASLDTLTTCFFACFGGEILSACLIKIFKLKKKDNDEIGGNVG